MDSRAQKRENESNDGTHSSSLSSHLQQESKQQEAPAAKSADYQTLFWVPLLFKTATNVENLIGEMLDLIQDFEYKTFPLLFSRKANNTTTAEMQAVSSRPFREEAVTGVLRSRGFEKLPLGF